MVLATHQVTEADLHRHQADWQRLQALRKAEQVNNELSYPPTKGNSGA